MKIEHVQQKWIKKGVNDKTVRNRLNELGYYREKSQMKIRIKLTKKKQLWRVCLFGFMAYQPV